MDLDQRHAAIKERPMPFSNQAGNGDEVTIHCKDPDSIVAAINDVMPKLPKDVRRALNRAKLRVLQRFGKQGLYERFNDRTVASLLEEFESESRFAPIDRGEMREVRYELYERPQGETNP